MSSILWWVPFTAGFEDGINPCAVMNAALVLLGLIWFKKNGFKSYWIIIFVVTIVICSFFLNCGFLDKFILHRKFLDVTRWIYVFLAIGVGIKGLIFLFQWIRCCQGKPDKEESIIKIKLSPLLLGFLIFIIGVILSVLTSIWPINYYISLFSIYMVMPDQFVPMLSLIFLYTLISYWLVFFMIWCGSIQSKNLRLFKIITAAILLSASVGVIDLFL